MNLNTVLVYGVDLAVENLVLARLERNHIKPDIEDHVATGILDHALEVIVFGVEVIPDDIDDVPKFFGALANKLLVNSKKHEIRLDHWSYYFSYQEL